MRRSISMVTGTSMPSKHQQAVLAKALYTNQAENRRELSFRRGDTLTVLEQDVAGLTGWWLCSLNGQTGIAPGNRLKLLHHHDHGNNSLLNGHAPASPSSSAAGQNGSCTPTGAANRNDWKSMWQARSKVVTPRRRGDVYVYDRSSSGSQASDYDVPPPPVKLDTGQAPHSVGNSSLPHGAQTGFDTPRSSRVSIEELYDVPRSEKDSASNRSSTFSTMSAGSTLSSASNMSFPSPLASHDTSADNGQCIYDVPPSRRSSRSNTSTASNNTNSFTSDVSDLYDTPAKLVTPVISASLKKSLENVCAESAHYCEPQEDPDYASPDEPKSSCSIISSYDGKMAADSLPDSVYDIPPQVTKDSPSMRKSGLHSSVEFLDARLKHLSASSQESRGSLDVPTIAFDQLPLELDAAMDKFVKLQQDLQSATARLLAFVSSTWRQRQNLEVHIYSIKMACTGFQTCFREFVVFAQGALANSTNASDKNLCVKLYRALLPLQCSLENLDRNIASLDAMKWDVSSLVVESKMNVLNKKADSLGAIVASAQDLLSDLRAVVSIVQANSSLLFRQKKEAHVKLPDGRVIDRHVSVPLPPPPVEAAMGAPALPDKAPLCADVNAVANGGKSTKNKDDANNSDYENDGKEWMDSYDYVHMEKRQQCNNTGVTSGKTKKQGVRAKNEKLENTVKVPLADKQLLLFYAAQVENQSAMLNDSIDAFLASIEQNQPPKVFVANSKFVVLNAHKLVYIGDTLHRNLLQADVRTNIMHGANNLCEMLKKALAVTKTAALQYPAIVAIQDMVDGVVDVSNSAHQLKLVITTAASLDVISKS